MWPGRDAEVVPVLGVDDPDARRTDDDQVELRVLRTRPLAVGKQVVAMSGQRRQSGGQASLGDRRGGETPGCRFRPLGLEPVLFASALMRCACCAADAPADIGNSLGFSQSGSFARLRPGLGAPDRGAAGRASKPADCRPLVVRWPHGWDDLTCVQSRATRGPPATQELVGRHDAGGTGNGPRRRSGQPRRAGGVGPRAVAGQGCRRRI